MKVLKYIKIIAIVVFIIALIVVFIEYLSKYIYYLFLIKLFMCVLPGLLTGILLKREIKTISPFATGVIGFIISIMVLMIVLFISYGNLIIKLSVNSSIADVLKLETINEWVFIIEVIVTIILTITIGALNAALAALYIVITNKK